MRKRLLAATLGTLALGAALSTGCTRTDSGGGPSGSGGERRFTFATSENTNGLDPVLQSNSATGDLSMFIYSYAVRYDDHAKPLPDALREIPTVANGDVSRDGLTLKYKLRPGITWQDGAPLTCADLKFTVAVVLNKANDVVTTDGYKDIASIDCTDPLVAVVHMKRIYAPFLQQLWGVNGNAPILPEHLLAKYNDAKGSFNTAPYQSLPIGSGPFRVVRWTRGDSVEMRAYDKFYLGKPKSDVVVEKIVPDQNTLVFEVKTHAVDLITHAGVSTWPQLQNVPGYVATAPPIYTFDHLDFDLRRPIFATDVDLRRALEMGLDRPAILKKIAFGLGDLANTPVSPVLSADVYDRSARAYPYDPAAAKALLEKDGWHLGPDGVRVKNGMRLAFELNTQNASSTGKAEEVLVQSYWHELGAVATVKNYSTEQFFDNSPTTGILTAGKYDVAFFAWTAAPDPDDSAIYSAHNLPPHGQNSLYWTNAVATRAMDAGLATIDRAERIRQSHVEQEQFADDVPSIIMYFRREPVSVSTHLTGYTTSPVISPFWDPWNYATTP